MLHFKRNITRITGLILLLLLSACGSTAKNPTIAVYQDAPTHQIPQQEYRINVGDKLDIKFFYNPELNEEITVRPDGRISLQLVHEIITAGLTPAELTGILTEKYSAEIERPEITVIVRSFSAQKVYIDGEVQNPGVLDLIRPLTVLQSISRAGGLKDSARINEVFVIRRKSDNKLLIIPINLLKAIEGTDIRQDIFLMPYDIVYVPKSPIANVNRWVDQYIRRNIPIPFGVGYSIN
jgi:protein involved in polysaccharide export with SLBB domain